MNAIKNIKTSCRLLAATFFCVLFAGSAYSGDITYADDPYTTGDTLTADDLNAKFNEIKTVVNDNNANVDTLSTLVNTKKSFYSGIVSSSVAEDCVTDEYGLGCSEKGLILINAPQGVQVAQQVVLTYLKLVGGVPTEVEEAINIEIANTPRIIQVPDGDTTIPLEVGREFIFDLSKGEDTLQFTLSVDNPFYGVQQAVGGFNLRAAIVADTQVMLTIMNVTSIKNISTESVGGIDETSLCGENQLHVSTTNYGDLKTDYIVSVTGDINIMQPVTAQTTVLEVAQTGNIIFDLKTHEHSSFSDGYPLTIKLSSPTGRLYEQVIINYQSPLPACPGG